MLLVNKPKGLTSYDVIRRLKEQIKDKSVKIGHAGTLDPLAEGLLIILLGKATKFAGALLKLGKSYEGEITLGASSSTDDAEGRITETSNKQQATRKPTQQEIEKILNKFIGEQEQVPPNFSAKKVGGKRAYKIARLGKVPNLQPQKVTIYSLLLIKYTYPILSIKTRVSSGTYIRALARDIGNKLGTGGYLSGLKRTSIGPYKLNDASNLDSLDKEKIKNSLQKVPASRMI